MGLEMSLDYRLRWMDFDRYGRIQPAAVLDLFQDLATLHAENVGIGRDAMLKEGVFWAVVRMKLEIVGNPERFQLVTVRTWPHTLTKFSFLRDFTLCDAEGKLLAKASQEWVLMDIEARKFASVKDHYFGPMEFCEERAFEKKLRKVPNFDEANLPSFTIVPRFSDIDVNGHVNNAMYANFIVNALDPGPERILKTLQIDYRYEVLPGSPLTVTAFEDGGRVLLKGVTAEGTTAFASAVEFA